MFSFEGEGFSCSFCKLQFLIKKKILKNFLQYFFYNFVIKTLDPDPDLLEMLDPGPDSMNHNTAAFPVKRFPYPV